MINRIIFCAMAGIMSAGLAYGSAPVSSQSDYESRKAAATKPTYFHLPEMSGEERDAMQFLYAYMPLPDVTDYSPEYYLENVRMALKAREEMPWGKSVPDREFYHFVLPVRVNNENLDSCRAVFYNELKDRIKGMNMTDAALEVNHWCHEKVTYQPSDSRTSSPLASVSSAIGRCGEESTFAVAALRSVGIPARQVYTPRWAHTDDNHAWVEVWVDGKWHFLGACEPEAILDLGWFNAPASRGMLMTTKAFGNYDGPEEKVSQSNCYTEINVTDNYAPTGIASVTVKDVDGNAVENATVEFKLYNYAEFHSIATKRTDSDGKASLRAGLGDLLIWASDGKKFGFGKYTVGKDKELTLTLDKNSDFAGTVEIDIVPPAQSATLPTPTKEAAAENELRKAKEDAIRKAYTDTFFSEEQSRELAKELGLDAGAVTEIMTNARGNHRTIATFLSGTAPADRQRAVRLLQNIAEKDCRDISPEVLADHLATPVVDSPLYDAYIMNPRISNEMLTPYKADLKRLFTPEFIKSCKADPQMLVEWCRDSINIDSNWNPQNLCMSPQSVALYRTTDRHSRDIFFVAGARSMGIAARIDPVTGKVQYAKNIISGDFVDVDFDGDKTETAGTPKGNLHLNYAQVGRISDPAYYSHFSISKIENGSPRLMEYPENLTLSKLEGDDARLDEGQYLIVSGQRMANGNVLARLDFCELKANTDTQQPLVIRQDSTGAQVIGNFNSENLYHDLDEAKDKSLLSTTGRGYYVLGLIAPNNEPTTHALNDISTSANELEAWGGKIMLLFENDGTASRFDRSRFSKLPQTVRFGTDIDGKIFGEIASNMKLSDRTMPVFIIADTFNRIIFISQGYTIGLGEQIINTLHKAE